MLGRTRRRVLVLDGGAPRNRFAPHMHGVLGRDHTSPLDLLAQGRAELARYGVEVREEIAVSARRDGDTIMVRVTSPDVPDPDAGGEELSARRLLVATGLRDDLPDIDGIGQFWGNGVASCPYCDGWEARDTRIGVIAGNAGGSHQAQLLRQLSDQVVFLTNGAPLLDSTGTLELTARGIEVEGRPVRRVRAEAGRIIGIDLDDGAGGTVPRGLDAIFVAPTPAPQDELLRELGARTAPHERFGGDWVAIDPTGLTSVPGVWAAGNVVNPMANVPLAMAAGVTAATAIDHSLIGEDVARAVAG